MITYLLSNPSHKCRWAFCLCHDVPSVNYTPALKQQECGEMAVLIDNLDSKIFVSFYTFLVIQRHEGTKTALEYLP